VEGSTVLLPMTMRLQPRDKPSMAIVHLQMKICLGKMT